MDNGWTFSSTMGAIETARHVFAVSAARSRSRFPAFPGSCRAAREMLDGYVTVHDAMADGHERLEVRCSTCRVTHLVPWRLLRGVLNGDRLDELHKRLVCKKCGSRPAQEDVGIPEPVKFPGGPLYGPR